MAKEHTIRSSRTYCIYSLFEDDPELEVIYVSGVGTFRKKKLPAKKIFGKDYPERYTIKFTPDMQRMRAFNERMSNGQESKQEEDVSSEANTEAAPADSSPGTDN